MQAIFLLINYSAPLLATLPQQLVAYTPKHLTGVKSAIAGPKYFKYKGEWLNSIRHRLGV